MTDTTNITYTVNDLLSCDTATHTVKGNQSVRGLVPNAAAILAFARSAYTDYKVFRNREGTHILLVHPNYIGTIDDKEMTAYANGQVHTNVFKQGFILPTTPICKKNPDQCPLERPAGSTVNIGSGRLSHSQEIFSTKGGQLPLSFTLYYRSQPFAPGSIGNGWEGLRGRCLLFFYCMI